MFKLVENNILKLKTFRYADENGNAIFAKIERDNSQFVLKLRIKNEQGIRIKPIVFKHPFDFEGYNIEADGENKTKEELQAFLDENSSICFESVDIVNRMLLITHALYVISNTPALVGLTGNSINKKLKETTEKKNNPASADELENIFISQCLDSISNFEEAKPLLKAFGYTKEQGGE